MMLTAIILAAAFPGNGFHCFGSPGGTGDLLPTHGQQYISAIAVLLQGREQRPVGWLYTSNKGEFFTQASGSASIRRYAPDSRDPGVRQFRCDFPMPLEKLPS
ncbi:MAG TPA: hypothetical protein VHT53_12105 [Candidatus Elarobacter sp.]|jgi:hypothetical protein|nr:hypothetical protein [Candidatus Elarobacter sp.]